MHKEDDFEVLKLCDRVRQIAYDLHLFLRNGHLEKIYENGLVHRLRKVGLRVEQQIPLRVQDKDGTPLGEYYPDLFVEECLVIELKACKALSNEHIAQMLGYLRASGQKHGLLINFGAPKLQIRKLVL